MLGSFSCENVFNHANSVTVAAASGGGGTRKSLPEEIAQVFQEPAFGSICPTPSWARALKTSTRTKNVRSVISLLIAILLQTFDSSTDTKRGNRSIRFLYKNES